MIAKYRLIEVWVTPGTKKKPETRRSKHTYYFTPKEAHIAMMNAAQGDADFIRLLEDVSPNRQVWHQPAHWDLGIQ